MQIKLCLGLMPVILMGMSACSHQQVAPDPIVSEQPVIKQPDITRKAPVSVPYHDIVEQPTREQIPVSRPVITSKPTPASEPEADPVQVPAVKAKGSYRGSVPVDELLREHYQQ